MKYHWHDIVSHESSSVHKASERIFDWIKIWQDTSLTRDHSIFSLCSRRTLGHSWLGISIFVRIRLFQVNRFLKHTNFLTGWKFVWRYFWKGHLLFPKIAVFYFLFWEVRFSLKTVELALSIIYAVNSWSQSKLKFLRFQRMSTKWAKKYSVSTKAAKTVIIA